MSARDKLKALAGGNIAESIATDRPASVAGNQPGIAGPPINRFHGLERIKGAFAIPLARIAPDPDQPRKEFDPEPLRWLAESLKARGQLMPVRVRWEEQGGRWVVVAGERRYRAAALAGLPTLLCVEAPGGMSRDDILEEQLIENCVREDLKPVEQARAYEALMNRRGWSQRQLGEYLHVSQSAVAKAMALLTLPPAIQADVDAGHIAPTVATELARVEDPGERDQLAAGVKAGTLRRAEVTRRVARKPARVCYRVAGGQVTVELRDGAGPDAVLAALREAAGLAQERDGAAA